MKISSLFILALLTIKSNNNESNELLTMLGLRDKVSSVNTRNITIV